MDALARAKGSHLTMHVRHRVLAAWIFLTPYLKTITLRLLARSNLDNVLSDLSTNFAEGTDYYAVLGVHMGVCMRADSPCILMLSRERTKHSIWQFRATSLCVAVQFKYSEERSQGRSKPIFATST